MPFRWNPETNEKLWSLIAANCKIDHDAIAELWGKEFPNDQDRPNGRGIYMRLLQLKKGTATGAANMAKTSTPKAKTSTPKSAVKRGAPKTPASSNKKARTSRMSDEDDSEEEEKLMTFDTPIPKREPSRRSASARKSYAQSDSEDDGPVSSAKASRITDTPAGSITNGDLRDSHSPIGAQRKSIARSKKDPKKLADVSSDEDDSYKPIQQEWV